MTSLFAEPSGRYQGPAVSLLADQQLDQAQKSLEQIVHRIHNNGEVSIAANRIY
jgi:hypothetical protein